MPDLFKHESVDLAAPGRRHFVITPSDTVELAQRPRSVFCAAGGSAVLVDDLGVAIAYQLTAGQVLPFGPVRVNATGTTASLIGWY